PGAAVRRPAGLLGALRLPQRRRFLEGAALRVLNSLLRANRGGAYSPARPVGNDSSGHIYRSLDVFATSSTTASPGTWAPSTRVTDYTSNPNFEQFGGRAVPFAGDYLWIDSVGTFSFGTWTDWRDTVAGVDQREVAALGGTPDADDATSPEFPGAFVSSADVHQCRSV